MKLLSAIEKAREYSREAGVKTARIARRDWIFQFAEFELSKEDKPLYLRKGITMRTRYAPTIDDYTAKDWRPLLPLYAEEKE